MASPRIRRDDMVKVISGKARGKTGRIMRVDREKDRVYVEGLNIQKRHRRARTPGETGGVLEIEGPIHISNVMLLDPNTGDATRVGVRREDGRRVRFAKRGGEKID